MRFLILFSSILLGFYCLMPNSALASDKNVEKVIIITDEVDDDEEETSTAFLGVYPSDLNDDNRKGFQGTGVYLSGVVDDSPAKGVGIREGDIIIKVDDKVVDGEEGFRKILSNYKPGDKVKVLVWRDGKEIHFEVELAERPDDKDFLIKFLGTKWAKEERAYLGVETHSISGDIAKEYFNVSEGVLIEEVVKGSPADKAGLKSGDVIVKIEGIKVKSTEDLSDAINKYKPGDKVKIEYYRKLKPSMVEVVLDKRETRKLVITDDDEEEIYLDGYLGVLSPEMKRFIKKCIKGIKIRVDENNRDLRIEIENLKKDLKELKKELKEKSKVDKDKGKKSDKYKEDSEDI